MGPQKTRIRRLAPPRKILVQQLLKLQRHPNRVYSSLSALHSRQRQPTPTRRRVGFLVRLSQRQAPACSRKHSNPRPTTQATCSRNLSRAFPPSPHLPRHRLRLKRLQTLLPLCQRPRQTARTCSALPRNLRKLLQHQPCPTSQVARHRRPNPSNHQNYPKFPRCMFLKNGPCRALSARRAVMVS